MSKRSTALCIIPEANPQHGGGGCQAFQRLAEVTQLNGLLPICSYCKNIGDDKGYWNTLEAYLSAHSEVDFAHGTCPDCRHRIVSRSEGKLQL